jgi:hypothetical protein
MGYLSSLTSDVQTQINSKTSSSSILANNNTWTGTNAFNTSIPTTSLTPSSGTQLITKTYGDSLITNLISGANLMVGVGVIHLIQIYLLAH